MVKNTVPEVCLDCGGLTRLIKHKFRCSEDFDCDALLETHPDKEWLEENAWLYDEDEDEDEERGT